MTLRIEKTTTRLRKPCSLLHLRGFGYKEILLRYSKTAQHTANFLTSAVRFLGGDFTNQVSAGQRLHCNLMNSPFGWDLTLPNIDSRQLISIAGAIIRM